MEEPTGESSTRIKKVWSHAHLGLGLILAGGLLMTNPIRQYEYMGLQIGAILSSVGLMLWIVTVIIYFVWLFRKKIKIGKP